MTPKPTSSTLRDIMGYTTITVLVSGLVSTVTLLLADVLVGLRPGGR